ncbi:MAG: META domain-containing protein [Luteimonas sp.]
MQGRPRLVAGEQTMMRVQLRASSVWCLVLAVALAGCAHQGTTALDGTRWTLAGWSISSQRAGGTGITAAFSDGKITGHGGVNTYGGAYTAAAETFSVASLHMTEMAGSESRMRAERAYMTLLEQAASYKRVDGVLTLYDHGGNESLVFEPASGNAIRQE